MFVGTYGSQAYAEHWARTLRWLFRLRQVAATDRGHIPELPGPGVDTTDHALAVLNHCFAMRDWLIKSNAVEEEIVHAFFRNSESLRLCRDLTNASKHLALERPSTEPRPFVFAGGRRGVPGWRMRVGGERASCDLVELCERCVYELEDFLAAHDRLLTPRLARDYGAPTAERVGTHQAVAK